MEWSGGWFGCFELQPAADLADALVRPLLMMGGTVEEYEILLSKIL